MLEIHIEQSPCSFWNLRAKTDPWPVQANMHKLSAAYLSCSAWLDFGSIELQAILYFQSLKGVFSKGVVN